MSNTLTNFELVLDLDSTLICAFLDTYQYNNLIQSGALNDEKNKSRFHKFYLVDVVTPAGTGKVTELWCVFRPHLREFIEFAILYFKRIYIWSAGQYKYVHAIVDLIFKEFNYKPSIIYTYDKCIIHEKQIYKPIVRLSEDPEVKCENLNKVFTLDDRTDTFAYNPLNGIKIHPYDPNPFSIDSLLQEDDALVKLMCWFAQSKIIEAPDVTKIDKSDIFTTSFDQYQKCLILQNEQENIIS